MIDWGIDSGLLVIRVVIGATLVFHGTQKMFGWFGGGGLSGATAFFQRLGYRPPRAMAIMAATIETAGGVLLLLGLLTPIAVVLLTATLVNVLVIHVRNGFDRHNNGFEYELALLAGVAGIALAGPGALSLDASLGIELASMARTISGLDAGAAWGAILILAGTVGGAVVSATRRHTT